MEFAELNERLSDDKDRGSTMQRLVELAVTSIPSCDWAAVTAWRKNASPRSVATSAETAWEVDELQYHLGEGPCLTSAADEAPVHLQDIGTEDRWPAFSAAVKPDTEVRRVLSLPLSGEPDRHALNLYSRTADAFDPDAVSTAIGILMNVHKITSEEAFERLTRSSSHLNRELRDIAHEVTETGTLPGPSGGAVRLS